MASTTAPATPSEGKPPFPPFTAESARVKVKAAQDVWNTKSVSHLLSPRPTSSLPFFTSSHLTANPQWTPLTSTGIPPWWKTLTRKTLSGAIETRFLRVEMRSLHSWLRSGRRRMGIGWGKSCLLSLTIRCVVTWHHFHFQPTCDFTWIWHERFWGMLWFLKLWLSGVSHWHVTTKHITIFALRHQYIVYHSPVVWLLMCYPSDSSTVLVRVAWWGRPVVQDVRARRLDLRTQRTHAQETDERQRCQDCQRAALVQRRRGCEQCTHRWGALVKMRGWDSERVA